MNNELNKYKRDFSFEDLDVWKKAVDFADEVISSVEQLNTGRKHFRLVEQLESSATSVSMNIAEGSGRYSRKEFIHFLYISRGSLYETVALLKIFHKRRWIDQDKLKALKNLAREIARMIAGLIKYFKNTQETID